MRAANITVNTIIITVCTWLFWQTFHFSTTFAQDGVGPAYFPRIILVIIIGTALIELVRSFRLEKGPIIPKNKRNIALRTGLFIAIIAIFIIMLEAVPFILAASISLFLIGMLLKLPLLPALLTSVGLSVSVYYLFTAGFNIIL